MARANPNITRFICVILYALPDFDQTANMIQWLGGDGLMRVRPSTVTREIGCPATCESEKSVALLHVMTVPM